MAFKRWSGGGVRATAILDGGCARCHWAQAGRDGETALRSNKETGPKDRKILGQHTTFLTKCPIQGWAKARSAVPTWKGPRWARGACHRAGPPGPAFGRPDGRLRPDPLALPTLLEFANVTGTQPRQNFAACANAGAPIPGT